MNTLLAVDGSDNSYEAVHALKYFARAKQLTLHLGSDRRRASTAHWYHFSRDDHEGGHSEAQFRQSGTLSVG